MSKKREGIKKALSNLNQIQKQIAEYNKSCQAAGETSRILIDIESNMQQELRDLEFWTESLYENNGKSHSRAKKISSRENGKKGGRPPKEVTEKRRRRNELENELIPQLEHQKKMLDDIVELSLTEEKLSEAKLELEEIVVFLDNYKK